MGPRPLARVLVLTALLGLFPAASAPQVLRLSSLEVPEDALPGPWVTYRVVKQSRSSPPRQLTQRAAVVSAEGIGEDAGVWIELKTIDPQTGTRIDRGFYGLPPGTDEPGAGAETPRKLRLRRVQRLHPDGKLYEYPPSSSAALRSDEEITTLGLMEVSSARPPAIDTLGVDTLRIGRKTLPSVIVRERRVGSDEWSEPGDTSHVFGVLLSQTARRCPEVPLTGITQSAFEVSTARFAVADTLREYPIPPADPSLVPVIYRVEMSLEDLGTGAVPEVTQEAEPAPDASEPDARPGVTH